MATQRDKTGIPEEAQPEPGESAEHGLPAFRDEHYWEAYREWKAISPPDLDATSRLTREEVHERIKTA